MSETSSNLKAFAGAGLAVLVVLAATDGLKRGAAPEADLAAGKGQDMAVATVAATPVAAGPTLDALLAAEKSLSLDRLAGTAWQTACLSRGTQPVPTGMEDCWPAVTDAALGGSFLNVRAADGQCRQWRTTRPVVDKRFEDAVCLDRAEVPALSLSLKGKIVDIE